jgi:hypothetical protein
MTTFLFKKPRKEQVWQAWFAKEAKHQFTNRPGIILGYDDF